MDDPGVSIPEVLEYDSRGRRWPGRWGRVAWVGCWVYPFVPLGGLYAAWVVAWMTLGHPPRASLDDPEGIGGIFDCFYFIALVTLMSMPLGIAGLAGLYVGALSLWIWDPLGVLGWYLD